RHRRRRRRPARDGAGQGQGRDARRRRPRGRGGGAARGRLAGLSRSRLKAGPTQDWFCLGAAGGRPAPTLTSARLPVMSLAFPWRPPESDGCGPPRGWCEPPPPEVLHGKSEEKAQPREQGSPPRPPRAHAYATGSLHTLQRDDPSAHDLRRVRVLPRTPGGRRRQPELAAPPLHAAPAVRARRRPGRGGRLTRMRCQDEKKGAQVQRVVLDAVGGDHAPAEVLKGVALALKRGHTVPGELILVGPRDLV